MTLSDAQRKAMFARLGNGARVKAEAVLGGNLKDIPKGSEGTVVDHFGSKKNPIVKFDNLRTVVVTNAKDLKLLKESRIFDFQFVKGKGNAQELKKKLLDSIGFSDGGGNFVHGFTSVFDETGVQSDVGFSVELFDNKAKVILLKKDIPRFAGDVIDILREEVEDKVEGVINES